MKSDKVQIVSGATFKEEMGMDHAEFAGRTALVAVGLDAACNSDSNLMVTMLVELLATLQVVGGDASTDEEHAIMLADAFRLNVAHHRSFKATRN